jgi:2,3-bisphosphoglycerate-dependent phosphoglycerate mutase
MLSLRGQAASQSTANARGFSKRRKTIAGKLILVRHGESEFNARNLFTGWLDVDLTPRGVDEARHVADMLLASVLGIDVVFVSALKRTERSARLILAKMGLADVPLIADAALNERDYGELSGLDKNEARARWGEAQVHAWRRSYAIAPPGGESLRDTIARVLPLYIQSILPAVLRDQSVLVVGHGNTLRSLSFVLDRLTAENITSVEFATGAVLVYSLEADSTVGSKRVLED